MTLSQYSTNGERQPSVAPSASSGSDPHDLALVLQLVRQLRRGVEQSRSACAERLAESPTESPTELQAERLQLEAQLGTAEPARIIERIQGLEGQLEVVTSSLSSLGQQLGTGDIGEFVTKSESTIKGLTEQLQSFQAESASSADASSADASSADAGSADAGSKGAIVQRIVEQLHALFAGGASQTDETWALANIVGQLHARYAKRGGATPGVKAAAVQSLVDQVQALNAEREKLTYAFGSADADHIAAFVLASERRRLVEQLHALYAEREERSRASAGEGPVAAIPSDRPSSSVAGPAATPEPGPRMPEPEAPIDEPAADVRPVMFGAGTVVVDDPPKAPAVPSNVVQIKRWAFVLDGDKVERREVITTVDEGNWLETAMGLSAADGVVITADSKAPSSQK